MSNKTLSKKTKRRILYEELSCALVTGIMKVVIIQPFDFIRFRIQSHSIGHHLHITKFIKNFIRGEGLQVFLKGVNVTTFSVFTSSLIQFTLYQRFYDYFCECNFKGNRKDIFDLIEENKESKQYLIRKMSFMSAISGGLSGLVMGLLLTPVDNVRIKLQAVQNIQNAADKTYKYRNSFECVKDIYATSGVRGFYVALPISIIRECIASVIYFGSFAYFKNKEKVRNNRKKIKLVNSFLYGAFAGGVNWMITLPIDVIKTKMISDTILRDKKQFESNSDCAKQIYRQSGIGGFYKGFSVVLTRALVVNGVVLTCFNLCRTKFIENNYN